MFSYQEEKSWTHINTIMYFMYLWMALCEYCNAMYIKTCFYSVQNRELAFQIKIFNVDMFECFWAKKSTLGTVWVPIKSIQKFKTHTLHYFYITYSTHRNHTLLTCRAFTLVDGCLDILCSCVHVPAVEKTERDWMHWSDGQSGPVWVWMHVFCLQLCVCMLQRAGEK